MRWRRIAYVALGLGLSALAVLPLRSYELPLARAETSLPARGIDFLGFVWHQNIAFWLDGFGQRDRARCEYIVSALFRPEYLPRYSHDPSDLEGIAAALSECQRYRSAARVFDASLASRPDAEPAEFRELGELYIKAGLHPEAAKAFRRAMESGSESPDEYERLGRAYELAGDLSAAAQSYRKALSMDPFTFRATSRLARIGNERERATLPDRVQTLLTRELAAREMDASAGSAFGDGWALWTAGKLSARINTMEGRYRLVVYARGQPGGGSWPEMVIAINDGEIGRVLVANSEWQKFDFPFEAPTEDEYAASITYPRDYHERNLYIQRLVVSPE